MSHYSHINSRTSEAHELSPFRDPSETRPFSNPDDQDFVSSIAPEDETHQHMSGNGEFGREFHSQKQGNIGPRTKVGFLSSNKQVLDHSGQSYCGRGQSTTRRICNPLESNSWTWETVAVLLNLAVTAIILLTLALLNNKKLPNWPLGITPNTLISILTTFSKSMLLFVVGQCLGQLKWVWFARRARPLKDIGTFDEASRGPWGSLLLIWLTRGVQLSSLGGLITILALAADPFNQQILSYRFGPTPTGNATIPYAFRFQTVGGDAMAMNTSMGNAIYQGLFGAENQNPLQELPFQCPTGNCTWSSEIVSLGVCSESANIATHLKSDCHAAQNEPAYQECIFSLPNGASVDLSTEVLLHSYNETKDSIAFGGYENFLSAFTVIGRNGSGSPDDAFAQEHVWYFCAQAYNANVTNGVISQNITKIWHNGTFPSSYDSKTGIDGGSPVSVANDYYILGPELPGLSPPQTFNVSTFDLIVLSMFLQNLTQGVGTIGSANNSASNSSAFSISLETFDYSQPSIQTLYLAKNITSVVSNMAGTMTNLVRTSQGLIPLPDPLPKGITAFPNPQLGNLPANGTAYSYQTFIEVRWPWFILSLVLALGGLGFLVGTVIASRLEKTTPWKNSALALLMHGLDTQSRKEFGGTDSVSEMEDLAEGTVLRLQVTSDGFKILSRT